MFRNWLNNHEKPGFFFLRSFRPIARYVGHGFQRSKEPRDHSPFLTDA